MPPHLICFCSVGSNQVTSFPLFTCISAKELGKKVLSTPGSRYICYNLGEEVKEHHYRYHDGEHHSQPGFFNEPA
jgi:hypothetical protein